MTKNYGIGHSDLADQLYNENCDVWDKNLSILTDREILDEFIKYTENKDNFNNFMLWFKSERLNHE